MSNCFLIQLVLFLTSFGIFVHFKVWSRLKSKTDSSLLAFSATVLPFISSGRLIVTEQRVFHLLSFPGICEIVASCPLVIGINKTILRNTGLGSTKLSFSSVAKTPPNPNNPPTQTPSNLKLISSTSEVFYKFRCILKITCL